PALDAAPVGDPPPPGARAFDGPDGEGAPPERRDRSEPRGGPAARPRRALTRRGGRLRAASARDALICRTGPPSDGRAHTRLDRRGCGRVRAHLDRLDRDAVALEVR